MSIRIGQVVTKVWPVIILCTLQPFGAGEAVAQARLAGVIRDSSGAPLAGAEVSVQDAPRTAITGPRGNFQIEAIKPGTVVVSVRRLGYAPYAAPVRVSAGNNTLPDIVLAAISRELDTVAIRDRQILREYPLLREFEENRRVGLGQFVTRAQLARMQGGFISPVLNQMRGLVVVRSRFVASRVWLASRYMVNVGNCTELEDRLGNEPIDPPNAACDYCFVQVFLDGHRLSTDHIAPNVGRFSPDQLQAVEIYQGPAEVPVRYASTRLSCGVAVFHSRVPEARPRVIAKQGDGPTRSRFFAAAGFSTATSGADCPDCARGSARDATIGYTIKDRWVIGWRVATWNASGGGAQSMTLRQAMMEWYPQPEPSRIKWFVNAGAGTTSVSLHTTHAPSYRDDFSGHSMTNMAVGTGLDVAVISRLVLTPFVSHTRTIGGRSSMTRCFNQIDGEGSPVTNCSYLPSQELVYSLTQLGMRFGWR